MTGNPARPEFFALEPWKERTPPVVLVMGGSQGARRLNELVIEALPHLDAAGAQLRIVLQCGPRWSDEVRRGVEAAASGVAVEVVPYLDDVPARLEQSSLVLCRSGASTVAELRASGRPSLLVPFPQAAGDHQTLNAESLARGGAARVLPQATLDGESLAGALVELLRDPGRLAEMARRARREARPDAAARIVDLVEAAGSGRRSVPQVSGVLA